MATKTVTQSDHVDAIDALVRKSFGDAAGGEAAEGSEAIGTVEEEAF